MILFIIYNKNIIYNKKKEIHVNICIYNETAHVSNFFYVKNYDKHNIIIHNNNVYRKYHT
jgi:hypothetical protein